MPVFFVHSTVSLCTLIKLPVQTHSFPMDLREELVRLVYQLRIFMFLILHSNGHGGIGDALILASNLSDHFYILVVFI